MSDLCVKCGAEVESELWGGKCKCGERAVHQVPCSLCGRICGTITDDDYCGPDVIACPDCMDEARARRKKGAST